jgi:two-component system LytT family response regulator
MLVDDERLARSSLRALLAVHPEIVIVAEVPTVRQARERIEAERPDVVFLDIQMPGGGGFALLEQLHDPPAIVFVTAHDEFAIRAFEVNAVDYLLKPVEPERLARAVARLHCEKGVRTQLCEAPEGPPACSADRFRQMSPDPFFAHGRVGPYTADDRVLIKTARRHFFLPVAQIAAIRAADNYSYVVCEEGQEHLVRRSLKEWGPLLPSDGFVVLDRSCLVNWRQVTKWVVRGREIQLYVGRLAKPLQLGRAAAHRFKTEVVPRIEHGKAAGE